MRQQYIEQCAAMGQPTREQRLEAENGHLKLQLLELKQENAQLKARLAESDRAYYDAAGTIDHLKERLAYQDRWLSGGVYYTNEEATALHKKHNEEVAQLKAIVAKSERAEMLDKALFSIAPADLTAEFYHNAANAARQMEERLTQATQREARAVGVITLLTTGEVGSFLAARFPATLREAKQALEEAGT